MSLVLIYTSKRERSLAMITLLGATGNIGSKLADILMKKGEQVRLVARSADALKKRVGRTAQAYAGDLKDLEFLTKAFKDSDAVFVMIPPDPTTNNVLALQDTIGESIARALELSKIKYAVNLSSMGADLAAGTGPIVGLHKQEERLNRIKGLHVLHLRPAYFMENLLMSIDLIKSKGIMGSAIKGELKFPMIATKDIAAYAAERLLKRDFAGSSIRYLLGPRDLSLTEAATIIGKKIGKPDLAYTTFPYDDTEKSLVAAGLSPDMSRAYIEMSKAFNDGRLIAGLKRTTERTTPTSFDTFCDEIFAPAYAQKIAAYGVSDREYC